MLKHNEEGGATILSENHWKDSNIKILRSMKSLGEFVGIIKDANTQLDVE